MMKLDICHQPMATEYTAISELRDRHGNSLRIAVADTDVNCLDARLLGGSSSGTVELKKITS